MKQTSISLDFERTLLIYLITNTEFCKALTPILQPNNLKTRYAQILSKWIIEYYDQYKEAPSSLIQNIFYDRKGSISDDEVIQSISDLIVSLSKEYTEKKLHNLDYAVEQSITYLKIRSLELHKDIVEDAISKGTPLKGEAAISSYNKIGLPSSDGVSLVNDKENIINSFMLENEYLFSFPGALKKTIGSPMRGDLISFMGKPKGKKSWALQFTAETAMKQGNNVVFVTLEMRMPQILRRAWQSMLAQPLYDMDVEMPYFSSISENLYAVDRKREHREAINLMEIEERQKTLKTMFDGDIRYISFPAYSATVDDIISQLDILEHFNNYQADVVIVDYADLIKPTKNGGLEYRHQLDSIWKALRALAQSKNILVVTASQSNRGGLTGDLTLEHIAEDVRKLAHCSVLVALNQNKAEKEIGVMRMATLLKRDDVSGLDDEAVVLQQLAIGKFYLDSKLVKEVEKIDDH